MASNTIKVLTAISKEISRRYDVRADVINSFNRQYAKPMKAWGSNSGASVQIKTPQKVTGTASTTLNIQDLGENSVTLTVNNPYHVGLGFTQAELTQDLLNPNNMKMFADDYLDAAIDDVLAYTQTQFATYISQQTFNSVGTPGTGPTTITPVTQARARLNNNRAPRQNRTFLLDPDNAALLNAGQSGLFHSGDAIASNYKDGALSPSHGFVFKESPDMVEHTNGSQDGNYVVNSAGTITGSTLTVKTGTGTIKAGDIFTIGSGANGLYAVDPVSGQSKGYLQQFVCTSDYAGGAGDVSISPPITTSGAYKTVNQAIGGDWALTFVGSASTAYGRGVAAHRDAFTFATAELADIGVTYEVPIITGGAGDGYSRDGGANPGVYMKLTMDGDITNLRSVARLDILFGYTKLVPEWAVAIQGA